MTPHQEPGHGSNRPPFSKREASHLGVSRLAGSLVLLASVLLLASCFDPPIRQTAHLELLPEGGVRIRVTMEISDDQETEAVGERVDTLRRALAEGWDEWTPRFEAVGPESERTVWEKEEGALTRFERSAVLADPAALTDFFADSGLGVFYGLREDTAELGIYPGSSYRANRRQRRLVEKALDEWVERLQAYLESAGRLYDYLDGRPGRAAVCFAHLLDDLVDSSTMERLGEQTEEEEEMLGELGEAMAEVWEILLVEPGEAYSLNELSQLVYDPFPSRITVRLPAPALEVEGFLEGPDGLLSAGGTGLWEALETLEGRWIRPDPLLLYVRNTRLEEEIDVEELAARPRAVARPLFGAEIRQSIEDGLEPRPAYRVTWVQPEP